VKTLTIIYFLPTASYVHQASMFILLSRQTFSKQSASYNDF